MVICASLSFRGDSCTRFQLSIGERLHSFVFLLYSLFVHNASKFLMLYLGIGRRDLK